MLGQPCFGLIKLLMQLHNLGFPVANIERAPQRRVTLFLTNHITVSPGLEKFIYLGLGCPQTRILLRIENYSGQDDIPCVQIRAFEDGHG